MPRLHGWRLAPLGSLSLSVRKWRPVGVRVASVPTATGDSATIVAPSKIRSVRSATLTSTWELTSDSLTSDRFTHPIVPLGRTGSCTCSQSPDRRTTRKVIASPKGWGLSKR